MTQKIPGYLRLHVEHRARTKVPRSESIPGLQSVCAAFERATGWLVRPVGGEPISGDGGLGEKEAVEACGLAIQSPVMPTAELPPITQESAEQLAAAIGELVRQLHQWRIALWKREAELAAGVPVTVHPDEEAHLATRLEAVLRSGTQAVGCQAAAAYLLDESTRQLKLRACWGLPKSRFLDPPRPLRGAAADLEALVGHAVVLEDVSFLPHWHVPEEFRSAVCVPISSPTTPLGTLWVFGDHPRDFSQHETNLLEIVAGRVAADLERQILLQQSLQCRKHKRQLTHAANWQAGRLPRIKPLVTGWEVAGWTRQAEQLGGDFHDWLVLPDGALAVAVGDAQGRMVEAGLTAATLHASLRSHAGYRHTAQQMVERVNETLWSASTGDQFASLFYAMLQPDTGEFEYAAAGHVHGQLVGESIRPLTVQLDCALGSQPDALYPAHRDRLGREEVLVVCSEGLIRSLKSGKRRNLWRMIHHHQTDPVDDLMALIQEFVEHEDGEQNDQTMLVVKRHPTT